MKLLLVDDEPQALSSLQRLLRRRGLRNVASCDNGAEAVRLISENDYDVVLLDLLMPGVGGLEVLRATRARVPCTEFIVVSALDDVKSSVAAVRLGAYDYLVKPVDNERLLLTIERAYERKGMRAGLVGCRRERGGEDVGEAFAPILTRSPRMREVLAYAEVMARGGNPVLVTGESGTGKELLARALHAAGPTPSGPLVTVNVASIPESLFESQFFGHVKGAFTGASRDHAGYFEQAHGGTLFLDEVGELPMHLQPKLLRALEDKAVTRVGGARPAQVDVRIVSATNRDLDAACAKGAFRLDLLYRIKSAVVFLPPLRERREDIPLLAGHFLRRAGARYGKELDGFTPEAVEALCAREYPGNVRELAQIVEHAALLADGPAVDVADLGIAPAASDPFVRTLCTLRANEDAHVAYVLTRTGGDRTRAAEVLGVSVRQLQRKLARLRADPAWSCLAGLGDDLVGDSASESATEPANESRPAGDGAGGGGN
ncbi:MAG: sigma-54-dependent Fis family transcriptional regulator [Desulfovibrionaceae bacterium]|jgi:DNA-binding NtrC family response regulator|nr:sigma-54-dependent Fis family transcriptional regulator [Desulfovibrionaceae bacterium]